MHVQYEMIPWRGFREEVQSVDADADAGRIPFRRVTKKTVKVINMIKSITDTDKILCQNQSKS